MENRKLRTKYKRLKNIFGFLTFSVWLIWCINLFSENTIEDLWFVIISFVSFGGFGVLSGYYNSLYRKLDAGLKGEEKTGLLLKSLGEGYEILENIHIEFHNKKSEIDFLILSSQGIVIIENKNYNGDLSGFEDDNELIYNKISNSGKFYSSKIRNPIKQLKRETYILKEILKEQDINKYIEGYVFLSGGQCSVETDKILCDSEQLIKVIQKSGRKNSLSKDEIEKIKSILKNK